MSRLKRINLLVPKKKYFKKAAMIVAFFSFTSANASKDANFSELLKKSQNLFLSGEREQALLSLKIKLESAKKEPQIVEEYQNISETFYLEKNQAEFENLIVNLHINSEMVLKKLTEMQLIEKKNGLIDYAISVAMLNLNQCSQLKSLVSLVPLSAKEKEIKLNYLYCSNQMKELESWLQKFDQKKPIASSIIFISAKMHYKNKNYTKAEQLIESELKGYENPELLMLKTLIYKELKKDYLQTKKMYLSFCNDKTNLVKRSNLYYPNLCKAATDLQELK